MAEDGCQPNRNRISYVAQCLTPCSLDNEVIWKCLNALGLENGKVANAAILVTNHIFATRNPMPASLEFVQPTIQALLPRLPIPVRLVFASLWLTGGLLKSIFSREPAINAMLRNTIAPTILQSGYKSNVLPEKASAVLNCRLLPGQAVDQLIDHIRTVINDPRITVTCLDTSAPSKRPGSIQTPWYQDLQARIAEVYGSLPICPILMVGASDARHYQDICACVYRFQPISFQKPQDDRTHGVDERIELSQLPVMVEFNARLMQSWGSR